MSDDAPLPLAGSGNVRASLQTMADALGESTQFDSETKAALAELIAALDHAAQSGAASSEEVAHLTDSVAHLLQALHEREESPPLVAAEKRLERAIQFAELKAPFLAGIARRFLDALADLGI